MIIRLSRRILRVWLVLLGAAVLASCEPPQVYGSVGYSSYSGGGYYRGGPSYGTSISVGGRIYYADAANNDVVGGVQILSP